MNQGMKIYGSGDMVKKLKKFSNGYNGKSSSSNGVATALTVIAWLIFIGGLIAGIVCGNVEVIRTTSEYDYIYKEYVTSYKVMEEFSVAVALAYWGVSFIGGVALLGLATIIKLLNDIKNK